MKPETGCKLISYLELSQSSEGLKLWNCYMKQITDIAKQHRDQFFTITAREIIPKDAKRHMFYAYLSEKNTIDSFCIIAIYCDTAEYLWAASHKDRRGSMPRLYEFIEHYVFSKEPQITKIIVMCAAEDSKTFEGGELIDGSKKSWEYTRSFHKRMDFNFAYKLEDYWGEGGNALVFIKRKKSNEYYGYKKRYFKNSILTPSRITKDTYKNINHMIIETTWSYLDAFDEMFVNSFNLTLNNDNDLKAVTGLILINGNNELCTIFAQKSRDPAKLNQSMRFEFDIHSSMLTKELFYHENTEGVLFYPATWDEGSDINISSYFKKYYNAESSDGYSVFFKKRPGEDNHSSIFYFITPAIKDVVWYLPLWKSLAYYSFALTLELYSYFSSLLVTKPELRNNDYFRSLIKAVSNTDFMVADKIVEIKKEIDNRLNEYHMILAQSKDTAFKNTGHLMAHRCGAIQKHLKEYTGKSLSDYKSFIEQGISQSKRTNPEDEHMFLAMQSTQNLRNTFQSLLLWGFDSLDAVWEEYRKEPRKLDRYFKRSNDPFDLGAFLYSEPLSIIEKRLVNSGDCIVTLHVNESKRFKYWLNPKIEFSSNSEQLHRFHLSDSVLSNVFYEIFLNAIRHGMTNTNAAKIATGYASISIGFDAYHIDGIPVLTVHNNVLLNSTEARNKYNEIPEHFKRVDTFIGNGLGLVGYNLSKLGLGNLWVRRFKNEYGEFYQVAVDLIGLKIEEV